MVELLAHFRIPFLFGSAFIAIGLTLLFFVGIVIPTVICSSVWIMLAVAVWMGFKAHRVPLISLSNVAVGLYLYASMALFWPVLYPQVTIAARATSFQTAEIFAKANHLVAI